MILDEIIREMEELEKTEESEFASNCLEVLRELKVASDTRKSVREEILTEANNIVNGTRNEAHGTPEDNFKRIAHFWSSYLEKEVTAHDVAIMMILLKVARTQSGTGSMDNYIDIAGYSACAGEIYKSMED